jgi:hypothetical protein
MEKRGKSHAALLIRTSALPQCGKALGNLRYTTFTAAAARSLDFPARMQCTDAPHACSSSNACREEELGGGKDWDGHRCQTWVKGLESAFMNRLFGMDTVANFHCPRKPSIRRHIRAPIDRDKSLQYNLANNYRRDTIITRRVL